MPRGSKPGERRGGRQKGTPNKKTALRNAAINAAAADPNVLPLDFLLALMRERNLPLETRITAAREALPYRHSRVRDATGDQRHPARYGAPPSRVNVNHGSGPDDRKVEMDKKETEKTVSGRAPLDGGGCVESKATAASDQGASGKDVSPLDFLLGVMRDREAAPHLRFKVASIVAPYIHPKQKIASTESNALDGFNIDFSTARALRDEEARYRRMRGNDPEWANVEARIAAIKRDLTYPPDYGTTEVTRDSRRLGELSDKNRSAKLTQKEDAEQATLNARVAAFKGTPEAEKWRSDCFRIWKLTFRKKFRHSLTDEEQAELDSLRALYPGLSHEPDDYDMRMALSFGEKILASGRRSDQTGSYYRQPKTG
jgi:uncharacterized protein YnzC (UPF0291/DUF896 family)